ncbi:kinetochore protein Spc25-like [Rhagoletis pomonella]|uniref:kinetochore protein Spc25-like n=1 Tax=Rhagoletis pomonella TaxID=28610 RepID=UPI00177C1F9A|nr:kinetochore protein Spc25-like [Rhagoletis pomonella]
MKRFDYGKRFKSMLNREIALEKHEIALSKLSSKYHEKLENLEIRYAQQKKKFCIIKQCIQQRRQNYDQLEEMIKYYSQLVETTENRLRLLFSPLDEIHSLKLATNTFINLRALPERIQGVSVRTTKYSPSWNPFCVEPLSHTPEELQKIIWGDSENAASYSEAWEQLVFRSVREMLQKKS